MAEKNEQDDEEVIVTKAWDSAVLGRLWQFARPHKRQFKVSCTVLVALFAFQLLSPWMLHSAIDGPVAAAQEAQVAQVALGVGGDTDFDATPYLTTLGWWAGGYLLAILLTAVLRYFEVAQLTRTGQSVIHDLRTELFRHIQRLDLAWFDKRPTGALVTRVTSDVENLSELFTSGLITLLFDLFKIVVVLGLLFWVSPPLALLVLALTPVLIGVSLVFRGGARRAHRLVRAKHARLNGYLQEVLSGMGVVHVFRREKRVSKRFGGYLADYLQANFRTIFLFAIFYPIISWVTVGM